MNGQSSSVNIAATASEVRITVIAYIRLQIIFFLNTPKSKIFI